MALLRGAVSANLSLISAECLSWPQQWPHWHGEQLWFQLYIKKRNHHHLPEFVMAITGKIVLQRGGRLHYNVGFLKHLWLKMGLVYRVCYHLLANSANSTDIFSRPFLWLATFKKTPSKSGQPVERETNFAFLNNLSECWKYINR